MALASARATSGGAVRSSSPVSSSTGQAIREGSAPWPRPRLRSCAHSLPRLRHQQFPHEGRHRRLIALGVVRKSCGDDRISDPGHALGPRLCRPVAESGARRLRRFGKRTDQGKACDAIRISGREVLANDGSERVPRQMHAVGTALAHDRAQVRNVCIDANFFSYRRAARPRKVIGDQAQIPFRICACGYQVLVLPPSP